MPSTSSSAGSDDTARLRRARVRLWALAAAVVAAVAIATGVLVAGAGDSDRRGPRSVDRMGADPVVAAVAPGEVAVGLPVPDFTLPGLAGGRVRLSDLRGRPVVLNVWASWCNPCREEFPMLRSAQRRYRRDRLVVVGVSFRDIAADARAFARSERADWPLARDPGGIFAAAYGVNRVPQTFFVDADGVLVSRVFGITSVADLDAEIAGIVPGGRPPG